MNKHLVKIRFNTNAVKDNSLPCWRVIIDEIEYLTHEVKIDIPCITTKDWINEEIGYKWHITCVSEKVDIKEDVIEIK